MDEHETPGSDRDGGASGEAPETLEQRGVAFFLARQQEVIARMEELAKVLGDAHASALKELIAMIDAPPQEAAVGARSRPELEAWGNAQLRILQLEHCVRGLFRNLWEATDAMRRVGSDGFPPALIDASDLLYRPVSDLGLSRRTVGKLKKGGIHIIYELLRLTEAELRDGRDTHPGEADGYGETVVDEILTQLAERGLRLRSSEESAATHHSRFGGGETQSRAPRLKLFPAARPEREARKSC